MTVVSTATCTTCGIATRAGTRFCVGCGTAIGPWSPPAGIPVPPAPTTAPAPARRSSRVLVACAVAVVVVLLGGLAAALLTLGPLAPSAGPAVSSAAGPAAGPPGAGPEADPEAELEATRGADRAAVGALVGSWVPQLSTKRVGLVADGRTWDAAAILAEHRDLRARYPQARLVWSGDYASFRGDDFWVTLVARPSSGAAAANAWCDAAGFDGDHCYAKRLARSGGSDGNAVMRDGAAGSATGSGVGTVSSGTAEPVVGDSGWAPGGKGWGTARPRNLNANGDGTSHVDDITWQSWGGPTATGRGTASWVPPDGFSSDGRPTPAVVVASDLGDCHGRLGYRRVAWYFPGKGETAPAPTDGYDAICTPA